MCWTKASRKLFKDSAENARKQFNAKNELQVEEFFAELESQVNDANRLAAVEQFNAGQKNSVTSLTHLCDSDKSIRT